MEKHVGKYEETGGRMMMPVTVRMNHAIWQNACSKRMIVLYSHYDQGTF